MTDTTTDKGLVERLRAEAQRFEFESVMTWWDGARKLIADGYRGSKPRDEFEALIDGVSDLLTEAATDIERLERERDEAHHRGVVSGLRQAGTYANGYDGIDPKSDWSTLSRFGEWLVAKSCKIEDRAESRLSRITAPVEGMGLETTEEERAAYDRLRLGNTNDTPAAIWTHASRRWVSNYVDKLHRDLESLSARLRVAEEIERESCAWMQDAAHRTLNIAIDKLKLLPPDGPCGIVHLTRMAAEIDSSEFSSAKLGRWLGWMQASVVVCGAATLDDMKNLNKQRARGES